MKIIRILAILCLVQHHVFATLIGDITNGGGPANTGGPDGWVSNLIIQEGDGTLAVNYQNLSGSDELISLNSWTFAANDSTAGDSITPFIVRLNDVNMNADFIDDNDFTVMWIGSTASGGTDYAAGLNTLNQSGNFTLQPNQVIAAAFIDSGIDGLNGATSVIKYNGAVVPVGTQWYDGQNALPHGAPTTLTQGQNFGGLTTSNVNDRLYHFGIDFTATAIPEPSSLVLLAGGMFALMARRKKVAR